MLLELAFALSPPAPDKTQYFIHLSFNSTFQLINGISKDLQKLLKFSMTQQLLHFLNSVCYVSFSVS